MKKIRHEIILIILLLFLPLFTWRHLPTLQFQGEGFYYFTRMDQTLSIKSVIGPLQEYRKHYEAFAISFFNLVGPIFKDQVDLYMWFMFIVMLLIDFTFYILVRVVTGGKLTAAVAFILFSLSFIGTYDMYSSGGYQYFIQRGILLLPLFISFIFLYKYIKSKKIGFFIIALALYLMSIIMGFYGTWFLAPFIFYPLFKKFFWLPVPFLIGNYYIVQDSNYAFPRDSIVELLFHKTGFIASGVIHQLTVLTLPFGWYKPLAQMTTHSISDNLWPYIFGPTLVFLYGGGIMLVKKSYPKGIDLALTAFVSLLSMLFFNLYLNAGATFSILVASRYFYYPSAMLALFWSLVIVSAFKEGNSKLKVTVALILSFWIVGNIVAVKEAFKDDYQKHKNNYDTISTLKKWSPQMHEEPSYLILPYKIGAYGGEFAKRFYVNQASFVAIEKLNEVNYQELAKRKVDPRRLFVLHYDETSETVVDQTDKWRNYLYQIENPQ